LLRLLCVCFLTMADQKKMLGFQRLNPFRLSTPLINSFRTNFCL
jgi:hypothetical protein